MERNVFRIKVKVIIEYIIKYTMNKIVPRFEIYELYFCFYMTRRIMEDKLLE